MGTETRHTDTAERTSPDTSRQRLYEVMADDGLSLSEKQATVLDIGRDYLGVELGFLSRIDRAAGSFEVVDCKSDIEWVEPGVEVDFSKTYCRDTVENDSALAVSDAETQGMEDHPAHREFGLSCYLGTPVRVDGDLFGTLCFVDRDRRPADFSESERAFVELAARMVGHERELRAREREVAEREQALERSERKYESLVGAAPDAIFLVDAETGTIAEANESAAELTGRSETDLVGMDVTEVHPPEMADQYRAAFRSSLESGGDIRDRLDDGTPLYVRHADGTDVPVEMSTEVVELDDGTYVQGIVRDITDRRERQRELRVKNRAIEHAPVGITIADADGDNELVYANEQFGATTGYDREESVGRNCRFLQGPETDGDETDRVRRALVSREPVETELLNYRADGTPFWNQLSIAPVENEDGETTHFVGFQHDITDRKRREQLISVLNRVLRHNLRNEMNVVMMQAERLRERFDGEAADIATSIFEAASSLTAMGEEARDIQRVVDSMDDPEPRDLVAMVEDVAEGLRDAHPGADVSVTAPDEQRALATRTVAEALDELGANAIEHSPGGTVAFEVEGTDHGAVVRVVDDGPGLQPGERRIFDRGRETQLTHGSGLGLWFVNWVVTGVGGQVDVTVEDGTTVAVHLRDPSDEDEDEDEEEDVDVDS